MNTPQDSLLGREVAYPSHYDPALLFPIPRAGARVEFGLDNAALPFVGHDRCNAYENPGLAPAQVELPGRRYPEAGMAQLDR